MDFYQKKYKSEFGFDLGEKIIKNIEGEYYFRDSIDTFSISSSEDGVSIFEIYFKNDLGNKSKILENIVEKTIEAHQKEILLDSQIEVEVPLEEIVDEEEDGKAVFDEGPLLKKISDLSDKLDEVIISNGKKDGIIETLKKINKEKDDEISSIVQIKQSRFEKIDSFEIALSRFEEKLESLNKGVLDVTNGHNKITETSTINFEKSSRYFDHLKNYLNKTNERLDKCFGSLNEDLSKVGNSLEGQKIYMENNAEEISLTKKSLNELIKNFNPFVERAAKDKEVFNENFEIIDKVSSELKINFEDKVKKIESNIFSIEKDLSKHVFDENNPHKLNHKQIGSKYNHWNSKKIDGIEVSKDIRKNAFLFFDAEEKKIVFKEDFSEGLPKEMTVLFSSNEGGDSKSYCENNSETWSTVGAFDFDGLDSWSVKQVKMVLSNFCINEEKKEFARLYDSINNKVICEVEIDSSIPYTKRFFDLDEMPSKNSLLLVQLKSEVEENYARIHSLSFSGNKTITI